MTKFIRRRARQRETDSIKLTTAAPAGSLRVMGFVVADDNSFISSMRFNDTKKIVQPNLYATNLRLRHAEPRIVLKNTSIAPISARPRFFTVNGELDNPVELPTMALLPEQIVEVDLTALRTAAASRTDFDSVSVEIENSGAPDSLIGAAYSSDNLTALTYDVPLRDSGKVRNLTGSYPWRIDNDYSTIVSITNVGDRPARFQVEIRYPGGPYSIKPRQLEPGQTAVFDLRKMRDDQTPDCTGKSLGVDRGQFHWSVVATPGEAHLIGRAEVVSPSARVVSSYSCPTCCPDSGPFGGFNPGAYGLYIDGSVATNSSGQYYDCYWNSYPTSIWWSSLSTWDTSVATFVTGTEDLHGEGPGFTYGIGNYDRTEWWTDNMDCYQYYSPMQDSANVDVAGAPDHLQIVSDVTTEFCTGGGPTSLHRTITYQVVDQYGNPVSVPLSIAERFFALNDHTCGAGAPQPSSCHVYSNGRFTDTLFAGCTPVGGSCGYDVLNEIVYCQSLAVPKPLGRLDEHVHADRITVNGNSTNFPPGTNIYP
ncbi:MAG TPA: hypothetical protein VJT71_11065 [Pyrinomonadaceae bacterium]|nr:hypothetical protein [Pyrinomonadaceae bacterium]